MILINSEEKHLGLTKQYKNQQRVYSMQILFMRYRCLQYVTFFICIFSLRAVAQTSHFTFTDNTGNNATVIVPVEIQPTIDDEDIVPGDEIGVFTPGGLCVGAGAWTGNSIAITVWGNNDQTTEVDGILPNEQMYFRLWRQSEDKEYRNVLAKYAEKTHYKSEGIYASNSLYLLDSLRTDDSIVSTGESQGNGIPQSFELLQNFPNPFNPSTVIRFSLPEAVYTKLEVFTITGQLIKVLIDEYLPAGHHEATLRPDGIASGVYYYRISAGEFSDTRTLIFMR
jgi:hypothetical protein